MEKLKLIQKKKDVHFAKSLFLLQVPLGLKVKTKESLFYDFLVYNGVICVRAIDFLYEFVLKIFFISVELVLNFNNFDTFLAIFCS